MCSSVDTYGFALCGLTDNERAAREKSLAKSSSFGAYKRLTARRRKERIRRGIPSELRPDIWMSLSGAEGLMAAYPVKYYGKLSAHKKPSREVLDAETVRSFQMNLGACGLDIVRRLLMAFELHSGMEMDKGMASIMAFILVVMGLDREEDVFWMFVSLLENKLFGNAPSKFNFWCRKQEGILRVLLKKKNAFLSEHIENLHKICDTWFSSLFVMTFPSETVARIWDCLFCEGPKVLQRIALATLIRNQNTILSMSHSVNLPKILTYKLRRTFDASDLMTISFHSIGSMKSAELTRIGEQVESELRGNSLEKKSGNWIRSHCA